jgi:predicted 2-oxoglutarate/Fe(II)-dependent dioxygenase YbiX
MSLIQATILSEELCATLRQVYDERVHLSQHKDYSGWPVLYWEQLRDAPGLRAVIRLLVKAVGTIIDLLGDGTHRIETVLMVALGSGGHHSAHADNRRLEGDAWVPNHTPQRSFSAIVYLNSDFEGGEIDFPDLGQRIKPTAGLLVAFPSDERYVHQVLPVTAGKRYSLALWFTQDPKHELKM